MRTLPGTEGLVAEVDRLAGRMKAEFKAHSYRDNWLPDDYGWMTEQLIEQLGKLLEAKRHVFTNEEILRRAAHVANFALLIMLASPRPPE